MIPARFRRAGWLGTLLLWCGCLDPFTTPSAYTTQRYLCDDGAEAPFSEHVRRCRQAQAERDGCQGVVSFTGALDGQELTVSSLLVGSVLRAGEGAGAGLLDHAAGRGQGPFFLFDLALESLGGASGQESAPRVLGLDPLAVALSGSLEDGWAGIALHMNHGDQEMTFRADLGGHLDVLEQSGAHLLGRFSATFTQEADESWDGIAHGALNGCFFYLQGPRRGGGT